VAAGRGGARSLRSSVVTASLPYLFEPVVDRTVASLRDVGVRRGDATLLTDVSWSIEPGERWVVLGANGAGKTTLLQVLSASLPPTTGAVSLLGEAVAEADLDDLLPRVGWASAALADRLPGDERVLDVVLGACYATTRRGAERYDAEDTARATSLLTQLGCRLLLDRSFGSLSEGERKRVQLARSLMTDPELLLLDEPAAGLDLGGREALLRLLTRLAADPLAPTTVLVSHHVEEVPAGFTHCLLLRQGSVVAAGPITDTLTSATLSVAFGFPLRVTCTDGRWAARAALSPVG
jgi:iron complex transport system ATP-binding protein